MFNPLHSSMAGCHVSAQPPALSTASPSPSTRRADHDATSAPNHQHPRVNPRHQPLPPLVFACERPCHLPHHQVSHPPTPDLPLARGPHHLNHHHPLATMQEGRIIRSGEGGAGMAHTEGSTNSGGHHNHDLGPMTTPPNTMMTTHTMLPRHHLHHLI